MLPRAVWVVIAIALCWYVERSELVASHEPAELRGMQVAVRRSPIAQRSWGRLALRGGKREASGLVLEADARRPEEDKGDEDAHAGTEDAVDDLMWLKDLDRRLGEWVSQNSTDISS